MLFDIFHYLSFSIVTESSYIANMSFRCFYFCFIFIVVVSVLTGFHCVVACFSTFFIIAELHYIHTIDNLPLSPKLVSIVVIFLRKLYSYFGRSIKSVIICISTDYFSSSVAILTKFTAALFLFYVQLRFRA